MRRVADDEQAALQQFVDKAAIEAVLVAYCRAIDRLDMDLLRECYAEDGVDDRGLFRGTVEELIPYVEQNVGSMLQTMHFLTNVHVEVDGGSGLSESYVLAYHRLPSSGGTTGLSDHFLGARYLDRWRRGDDGRWRITERRVVWDWSRTDLLKRTWKVPESALLPQRGPKDPSYGHCLWSM